MRYHSYLPEPLESHREHKEARSLWTPFLPRHVRSADVLLVGIDILNQRPVVHHEACRLPSSPVCHRVMMQRKDMYAGVARGSKWHVSRRAGEEWARRRRQLEEHAMIVRRREVQRRDVRRPLGRQASPKLVNADLAAVLERRNYVRPRGKERKVPDAFGSLVLLNEL